MEPSEVETFDERGDPKQSFALFAAVTAVLAPSSSLTAGAGTR